MQVSEQEQQEAKRIEQERAEFQAGLKQMIAEVKRKLKPESKNELLRIISALLVDNYMLKLQLEQLTAQPAVEKSTENA